MPSTLTLRGDDGKQSEKIERNTRFGLSGEILLRLSGEMLQMVAPGFGDAQSAD